MTGVYWDTSAVVKLVGREKGSEELENWLGTWLTDHPDSTMLSSAVLQTELLRSASRLGTHATQRARQVLASFSMVELSSELLNRAGALAPPALRSLDALHAQTVIELGPLIEVVLCYDRRLSQALSDYGFSVVSPGLSAE